ncbi:hypothetical protein FNV61_55600 [Streptomyces sp. RLB3-6]|nr:hypothetical protein FNV61_55600 [Streptomyces sp. RLB3-6]
MTEIDGLDIHFIHVRSKSRPTPAGARPVLRGPGGDNLTVRALERTAARLLHPGSASGWCGNKDLDNPHSHWSEALSAFLITSRAAHLV